MPNKNTHRFVVNVPETAGETSRGICGCPTWIDHWRRHTGTARKTCVVYGCTNEPTHGAHVRNADRRRDQSTVIVGLCPTHNHYRNAGEMQVDLRTRAVPAEYLTGCGVLYDLEPGHFVRPRPDAEERFRLEACLRAPGGDSPDSARWTVLDVDGERRDVTLRGRHVRRVSGFGARW